MNRVAMWIMYRELRWFDLINQRIRHRILDKLLPKITHLGGATFTISFSILIMFMNPMNLRVAGFQSLLALIISHIPVAFLKKKYGRLRPYQVIPETNLCIHPLKDHSFPSGHSTAIFATVVPYILFEPMLAFALIPLALTVTFSRVYIGLHYPSDCLVGIILGTVTAISVVEFWF